MKKYLWLVLLITSVHVSAQRVTQVYFGLGYFHSSFQDTRFTNYIISKGALKPELGLFLERDKYIITSNVSGFQLKHIRKENQAIETQILGYNIRASYARRLKNGFSIGGNWDILDYYNHDHTILSNGANAYKLSSDIMAQVLYQYPINKVFRLRVRLDYGLISFINSAPSFSANFPQNVIDNGEVSFSDSEVRRPLSLKHMTTKGFWEQVHMRTALSCAYKKRLEFSYIWEMRNYADRKGYPVTNAYHSLMLRFNFISKPKTL